MDDSTYGWSKLGGLVVISTNEELRYCNVVLLSAILLGRDVQAVYLYSTVVALDSTMSVHRCKICRQVLPRKAEVQLTCTLLTVMDCLASSQQVSLPQFIIIERNFCNIA